MSTPASPLPTLTVLGRMVRPVVLVPVPPLPVSTMVAAPAAVVGGTIKERLVVPKVEKEVAIPLTVTLLRPTKLVPVTDTLAPGSTLVGVKLVIVGAVEGAAVTVKGVLLVTVPAGVVTVTVPLVAAAGTVKVMLVALATTKVTAVVPSVTAVAPVKLVPVRVTVAPGIPLVGAKLLRVGKAGAGTGSGVDLQPASHRPPTAALAPE